MARTSRKSFAVVRLVSREPNGRLARQPETAASEVKRLRDQAKRTVRLAEYGTELGRLFLTDTISATMYAAGKRLWNLNDTYQAAMQSPRVARLSIGGGRAQPLDPDSELGELEARRHAKQVLDYEAAMSTLSRDDSRAIDRVVLEGLPLVGYEQVINLRCGLLCLAHHFGLTNENRRVVR